MTATRELNRAIEALRSQDYATWIAGWRVLFPLRDPSAVEPLITALRDRNSRVRHTAATALGHIGDSRAVEPLRKILPDRKGAAYDPVGAAAARALGEIGDPRAVEPHIRALRYSHPAISSAAIVALSESATAGRWSL